MRLMRGCLKGRRGGYLGESRSRRGRSRTCCKSPLGLYRREPVESSLQVSRLQRFGRDATTALNERRERAHSTSCRRPTRMPSSRSDHYRKMSTSRRLRAGLPSMAKGSRYEFVSHLCRSKEASKRPYESKRSAKAQRSATFISVESANGNSPFLNQFRSIQLNPLLVLFRL
jgi:hypothetical protein